MYLRTETIFQTSVKQLRKLWDNLKTRRKNELLRERLMDEEHAMMDSKNSIHLYDSSVKDEVNDSLDSINASMNYHSSNDVPYINGGSQHNWAPLPIETVIVEDEETYKDVRTEDDEQIADKDSFTSSNRLNNGKLIGKLILFSKSSCMNYLCSF